MTTVYSEFTAAGLGGLGMVLNGVMVDFDSSNLTAHEAHGGWTPASFAFDSALQTTINATSGLSGFTVDFTTGSFAGKAYTISHASTFTVGFGIGPRGFWMRRILGFSGNLTGANSYTSDVWPWFMNETPHDCFSNLKLDHEQKDDAWSKAENGLIAGNLIHRASKKVNMRVPFVPRAEVYKAERSDGDMWGWEHFFHHHRLGYRFYVTPSDHIGDDASTWLKFSEDNLLYEPVEVYANNVKEYHVDLRCYLGRSGNFS